MVGCACLWFWLRSSKLNPRTMFSIGGLIIALLVKDEVSVEHRDIVIVFNTG